jgi:hypothetical protein
MPGSFPSGYSGCAEFRSAELWTRREMLCSGGLSVLGLGLTDLLAVSRARGGTDDASGSFGKAKACILLFMWGGPSQLDTWDPWCYSAVLAGGGIHGGQVYGKSDAQAAHPAENPVSPADLTAIIFHALGIRPGTVVQDREGRSISLTEGSPVVPLFG